MWSATEFSRIDRSVGSRDRIYLHDIRVLLPETSDDSCRARLVFLHFLEDYLGIFLDDIIDEIFHLFQLLRCHFLPMREIKSQSLCRDIRSCLIDMIPEDFAKSCEQEMCCCMVFCLHLTPPRESSLKFPLTGSTG